jgi:hypothetical protein
MEDFMINNGTVTIRAWTCEVVISEHLVSTDVYSDDTTDDNHLVIQSYKIFDIDNSINLVQVIISGKWQYDLDIS